jgi:parvulin-like peptidyl-prolyl isomerase
MRAPMKWPLVHFALLGFGLFVSVRLLSPSDETEQAPDTRIVVSRSQVAALVSQYEATTHIAATDDVRAELIQRFAEEEMLCREAHRWGLTENNQAIDLRLRQKMAFVSDEELSDEELERQAKALGMDSDDAVIRNMLAHNMRLLLAREGEQEPTDEEIEAYYESERSRFARPTRLTGWHVFFSKDLRQSSAPVAARKAKARLNVEVLEPNKAVELGDVSPSGAHFKGQLPRQLASRFGEEFAKVAKSLPEDQWSDPVETPFGAHLVLIEKRTPPQSPPLEEIRARVSASYQSSQRQKHLATAMEELRARYEVVVE